MTEVELFYFLVATVMSVIGRDNLCDTLKYTHCNLIQPPCCDDMVCNKILCEYIINHYDKNKIDY